VIRHRHHLALRLVSERAHAARRVIRRARRVRFEEQPPLVQNPEEFIAGIKAMRAEHRPPAWPKRRVSQPTIALRRGEGPRAQLRQRAQLVEHKFFERVVRHGWKNLLFAFFHKSLGQFNFANQVFGHIICILTNPLKILNYFTRSRIC